ncbi:heat shock 70 kDa protein 12A-like [Pecten maximus]|uniref:heat shock 70 kDa protein 12A-like n=1 Tax=Pecten maximus TaxID=6579 RepID=UPI001458D58F|nr:heat shock 70 kDa protein 12A-like [Pecten maximus]
MASRYGRESRYDRECVVAIDIGTTYSHYAFSFRHEYVNNPRQIYVNRPYGNMHSEKGPTCVLLKPDQTFHSFGFEAEDQYTELVEDAEHEDWYFFKRFKTSLQKSMALRQDHMIPDVTGKKELPAMDIFAHVIKYLKDDLMNRLSDERSFEIPGGDSSSIHWVLTVPAIWNEIAKEIMRKAAQKAGIRQDNLTVALEPEAAALFCRTSLREELDIGTEYMVIDLGGETVDVTVQRHVKDRVLEELFKASGGSFGGTNVDKSFLELLVQIVGTYAVDKIKHTEDELELFRWFEMRKRTISNDCNNSVSLMIPKQMLDIFEKEFGTSLKEHIEQTNFKGKIKSRGNKLIIDPDIFRSLFTPSADSIVCYIKDIFKKEACRNVSTFLMVGGFSECALIHNAIRKNFPDKRVIIPEDAGLAVVKGAVLFGQRPPVIRARVSRYTYGIAVARKFQSGDPAENKITVRGVDFCRGVFSKHVEVGETVPIGKAVESQKYSPLYKNSNSVLVRVVTSLEKNPRYTTDQYCNQLGTIEVLFSPGENIVIEVKLLFGKTELTVEASEENGKSITATFYLESKSSQYDPREDAEKDLVYQ